MALTMTFLGTGGSEGYPAAFCACARCAHARALGGKNIRRRSSVLINDDLLIDLGPDVSAALQDLRLSLARTSTVLITHAHDDHFLPITLRYRKPSYGVHDLPWLTVYGSAPTVRRLTEVPFPLEMLRVAAREVAAGTWVEAGPYRVLPLQATHAPDMQPLLFVLQRDDVAVLYATDTGVFPPATWAGLSGVRLDAAVLNTCFWDDVSAENDPYHLTVQKSLEHAAELRSRGILKAGARVFGTHVTHRSQPDHATLASRLAEGDMEPAYDGLVVTLGAPAA